jgi:hypothetical protein
LKAGGGGVTGRTYLGPTRQPVVSTATAERVRVRVLLRLDMVFLLWMERVLV